ncbi:MAG: hypothetical protein ACHREM_06330, partial [Polyangiales bacterium]
MKNTMNSTTENPNVIATRMWSEGTHEGEIISEHADGKSYCWSTYTLLDTGETAYFQETMPESH